MTIKELEERTGMIRANIRCYESEGLTAIDGADPYFFKTVTITIIGSD